MAIARCEAAYAVVATFKKTGACKSCKMANCDKNFAAVNCACFLGEIAARSAYLKLKCDYILLCSITRGSKIAENGHLKQLADKGLAAAVCCAKSLVP